MLEIKRLHLATLTVADIDMRAYDWFDFMNGRFELLDGDAEIMPGLSVVTTPGHPPTCSPGESRSSDCTA
jgi:hypothetical protein